MEFSIQFETVRSGWSIVYIEGLQVIISKNIKFLSPKIYPVLANSTDPNEMTLYGAFHLGPHCFCKDTRLGVSGPQRVKQLKNSCLNAHGRKNICQEFT